jgi:hypothetical protein
MQCRHTVGVLEGSVSAIRMEIQFLWVKLFRTVAIHRHVRIIVIVFFQKFDIPTYRAVSIIVIGEERRNVQLVGPSVRISVDVVPCIRRTPRRSFFVKYYYLHKVYSLYMTHQ